MGAFFCWGNETFAYTYNTQNITIDKIIEDENDLTITGMSSVICNESINPQKRKQQQIEKNETAYCLDIAEVRSDNSGVDTLKNMPARVSPELGEMLNQKLAKWKNEHNYDVIGDINKCYGFNIEIDEEDYGWEDSVGSQINGILYNISYVNGLMYRNGKQFVGENYSSGKKEIKRTETETITEDASIQIISSTLTTKGNIQTSKSLNLHTIGKLNAANSITAESITASGGSTITGASLTTKKLQIDTNSTIEIIGDIKADYINLSGGKVKAKNLATNSLFDGIGTIDISKGTFMLNEYLNTPLGQGIKAKFLKVKNTTGHTNSIESDTHITGGLTLKGKAQTISAGAANTDVINKVQMTTALNNAKPKLGKTYSAGNGIKLSTNNAVGLTNAAAYATSDNKRISLVGAAKTYVKKVKTGKVSATSKDLINGSQLYSVQQSIAGFADRIQTNKNQLESLKSSINAKKAELSGIQKNLNTIKGTKLSQDMSNLTTDGEAVIKSQVQKAIQKFQKDMELSTVQTNTQEAKISGAMEAKPTESCKPSIMLADTPIEAASEPVNAVSAISKEDVAAKADLSQTKINLEKKATLNTMNVAAYTKQLSKGLATGESAYHALQKAKEDRLIQVKENTLTVSANGAETKIDASKKNWTGILVDEKEAGSMANVGYVDQTLSMESSYDKLSLMKKDLEKDTNKGIAKAAALAALKPIGHDEEDKVSFAIGYGHYKDGNAAAIGTFYRPSQDVLIHLDVTAGAGKPSMNTGVSFKVGKGSNYASMTREQLAEENATMRNQAEKQAERIQTQKEKIEHLESVMQSIRF